MLALGKWLSKEAAADVERTLWHAMLVGVVMARLAFAYEHRTLYHARISVSRRQDSSAGRVRGKADRCQPLGDVVSALCA